MVILEDQQNGNIFYHVSYRIFLIRIPRDEIDAKEKDCQFGGVTYAFDVFVAGVIQWAQRSLIHDVVQYSYKLA